MKIDRQDLPGIREQLDLFGEAAAKLEIELRRIGDHRISDRLVAIAHALWMVHGEGLAQGVVNTVQNGWVRCTPADRAALFDDVEVLLAVPNHLGSAYGGDGTVLHPAHPISYFIACWDSEHNRWRATETEQDGSPVYLEPDEPSHWKQLGFPALDGAPPPPAPPKEKLIREDDIRRRRGPDRRG